MKTKGLCDSQSMNCQSVANTDEQTSQDAGLYPVGLGERSTEYSSIKGTVQNMQCKMQDMKNFPKPETECFSPVLLCDS